MTGVTALCPELLHDCRKGGRIQSRFLCLQPPPFWKKLIYESSLCEDAASCILKERSRHNRSKMALASGHWIRKDVAGDIPDPRHGQALAVAGNIAIMFGGCSFYNTSDDQPTYFNDFYMLTSDLI
uniref:Uncharacterized protein n=1 Tax=Sphaerodactylus townsendi TaxID=933632 RepID=A0ACB8ERL4_9SAUR